MRACACDARALYLLNVREGVEETRLKVLDHEQLLEREDDAKAGSTYREGMQRELDEEVSMDTAFTEHCVGLINDDETEVGKVHLGIVHIFDLELPKVLPREESIIETGFDSPEKLLQELDQFETWSQICLKGLFDLN